MTSAIRQVLIAGGGPVGSVLALALSRSGVDVTLVDSQPVASAVGNDGLAGARRASTNGDSRPIALSASSARILDTLGIWQPVARQACPIQMVHVCEQGGFGAVRLRASEHGVPALGYVTDAAVIAAVLADAVEQAAQVTCIRAARVDDVFAGPEHLRIEFETRHGDEPGQQDCHSNRHSERHSRRNSRDAQLLVVADGGHSSLCANLGIVSLHRDYQQSAVVCTVTPERAHQGVAYERFTPRGPLALLPMASGDCALVWTLPQDHAQETAAMNDADFACVLQESFGRRLGRLSPISARNLFPLSLVRAQQLRAARVVLIGNAANRLHPVAGQGLNLGLRDAAVLADLIAQAARSDEDLGGDALLQLYARARRAEHKGIVLFTDALAHGFSAGPQWLGWLRGAGLLALDLLPVAGRVLARHAMGLGGSQARMVRGLTHDRTEPMTGPN